MQQPISIERTSIIPPEIEISKTAINTSEPQTDENKLSKIHFSESGIEFDYPSNLNVKETQGEDGSKTEFTKNKILIFWYEQGENWRVNMEWDKNTYQKILADQYPDAIIDKYTKTTINNIEMINIIFYPSGQDTGEKIEEYIFIDQYAFYNFYFTKAEDEFVDELMNSVKFITN